MSKHPPHMEDFFKKQFQDFEVAPSPELWGKIEANLPQKKRKKRVFLLWTTPIGIAASILVFFFLNKENSIHKNRKLEEVVFEEEVCPEENILESVSKEAYIEDAIVLEKTNPIKADKTQLSKGPLKGKGTKIVAQNNSIKKNFTSTEPNKNLFKLKEKQKKEIETKYEKEIVLGGKQKNEEKFSRFKRIETSKQIQKSEIKKEMSEGGLLVENELEKIEEENNKEEIKIEKENPNQKWSIQPQVAPLIYDSFSGGSTLSSESFAVSQSSDTQLSYGVKIAYQISSKIEIRAGISSANIQLLSQSIGEEDLFSGVSAIDFDSFSEDQVSSPTESFNESPPVTANDSPAAPETPRTPNSAEQPDTLVVSDGGEPNPLNINKSGSLTQTISYIEVPLETSFKIIDKRFGLGLVTGISTFILNQSSSNIVFEGDNINNRTGEATNLNSFSFSGNIGLSLDYKLYKNLRLSVEPILKYQFNAFDNNTDFQPYIFGIYTGLKFNL